MLRKVVAKKTIVPKEEGKASREKATVSSAWFYAPGRGGPQRGQANGVEKGGEKSAKRSCNC